MSTLIELSDQDFVSTEEIQDRIDELETLLDGINEDELILFIEEKEELETLIDLKDEIGDYTFENQETLIRATEIKDYLVDMVYDIGDLPKELPSYIESNINWDGVVSDLLYDYSEVEINDVTFYFRSY